MIDVVYPVRPGEANPELKFSLRCLEANLPHRHVWIVGHKPEWVSDRVGFIPGNNAPHRRANLWWNLLAACRQPDLTDEVVIMNDDFYITTPIDKVPVLYRSTLQAHLDKPRVQRGSAWWRRSLETTQIILQALGYDEPISYELHTPFRVNRAAMADILERFSQITPDNPPQWRTLYGNLQNIGGVEHQDGKAYSQGPLAEPFHSTDDNTFRHFRAQLQQRFPQPSRYENPRVSAIDNRLVAR